MPDFDNNNPPRPPLVQIIIYAIGQYGWSLASFGAGSLLVYFYMPAEDGIERFPAFFNQGPILGILTIVGLLAAAGRVLDAFTDPWIAKMSDRMKISGIGKRKKFLAFAVLPFALCSFLLFFPLINAPSIWNVIWLVLISILYYISFTMYLIPYNALIAELGHDPKDRMLISSIISLTWIFGFSTGFTIFILNGMMAESGYGYQESFQYLIGAYSIIAFICMCFPILFLKENKYAKQTEEVSEISGMSSFFKLIREDDKLRIFVLSDLTYWLSATFIQMGVAYYISILMGKNGADSTLFLGIALVCSLLFYIPINIMVKKFGKKVVTLIAFGCYIIVFGITGFVDKLPLDIDILFYFSAVLAAFPMASFGIIPNAIVADLIYENEKKTGKNQAGIYYAVRTFMMKIGITFANLIFPSLLLLGKSIENPTGVRATAIAALVFCLIGMLIFSRYDDTITEDKVEIPDILDH